MLKTFTKHAVIFLLLSAPMCLWATEKDSTVAENAVVPLKSPTNTVGTRQPVAVEEPEKNTYKRWTKLKYSGYIRSYNQFRHLPFAPGYDKVTEENLFTINGLDIRAQGGTFTGYQEPLFLLRLEGAITSKSFFKAEYLFDHQMLGTFNNDLTTTGNGPSSTSNRRAMVYRVLEFTAGANTSIGSFKLMAGGGVMWYRLSPFTYWNFEYRDDMFERYPWEPEGSSWGRYNRFYSDQNISRDSRWGNTGTQGFILEGNGLPLGFNFAAIYGKTDNSGGFQTYLARTPKNVAAGKIEKSLGKHKLGINYFNQFGFTDGSAHPVYYDQDSASLGISGTPTGTRNDYLATSMLKTRQQIVTADGRINLKNIKIYTELGMGRYQDSLINADLHREEDMGLIQTIIEDSIGLQKSGNYYVGGLNYNWGHAFNLQVEFDKALTRVPFGLQVYSISKSVVNVNSAVLNSANPHALNDLRNVGTANDITTIEGAITDVQNQQMTNNRWGFRLKHEESYRKLKLMVGINWEQEHENLFNVVSFHHQLNSFTRSRFGYFQRFIGPYYRVINLFRRSFEQIPITDTVVDYKKGYNGIALGLKYKFNVLNRDLIISSYSNYNSVTPGFSLIPKFSDEAFLRVFYQEFMAFYAVHPQLTLIGTLGFERNVANMRTALVDDSTGNYILNENETDYAYRPEGGKAMNQYGTGYGLGFDYDIKGRAGIFFRHRWFFHEDRNQFKDKFYGQETTLELKIFF